MLRFGPAKSAAVLLLILLGFVFALPNFVGRDGQTRLEEISFLPSKPVTLGLDLRGGCHLLMSVDIDSLATERLRSVSTQILDEFRGSPRISLRDYYDTNVAFTVTLNEPSAADRAIDALEAFRPKLSEKAGVPITFDLEKIDERTLELTFFGDNGRDILRAFESKKPPEKAVDHLRSALREGGVFGFSIGRSSFISARLKEPSQTVDALGRIDALDRQLAEDLNVEKAIDVVDFGDGRLEVVLHEGSLDGLARRTVQDSIEVVRRRIDPEGNREVTVQRSGADRILVQIPGSIESGAEPVIGEPIGDPTGEPIGEPIGENQPKPNGNDDETGGAGPSGSSEGSSLAETASGAAGVCPEDELTKVAKLTFQTVPPGVTPAEAAFLPGVEALPYPRDPSGLGMIAVNTNVLIDGSSLERAVLATDPETGAPVVSFRFDRAGTQAMAALTSPPENKGRQFAIILDGEVISAPEIRTPIRGGQGVIEGGFTPQTADLLARLMQGGALPAPLETIERKQVGPELGADSIRAGEIAGLIALVAVVVFMLAAYGMFGLFANLSLTANIILILGALSAFGSTLTLPGIAGIILTIGMAVDANVLVFERIREERRAGRSPLAAVETGYERAMSTIFDANITTFIAAAVLYLIGAGPVRGFAVTLAVGVVTSVFTAFVFSRMLTAWWLKTARPKELPVG